MFLSCCIFDDFFLFFLIGFLGILGPPYGGISATIYIGQEMLCVPYAGFLVYSLFYNISSLAMISSKGLQFLYKNNDLICFKIFNFEH